MAGLLMDVGVGRRPDALEDVDGDYRALRQQLLDHHILLDVDPGPVRSETLLLAQCWGADAVDGIADLTQIDIPDLRALQERLLSGACKAAA